ncbi:MAG: heme biosynthesis HemY N-terminal domain-containing protein [Rhodocyclaceae bacterium]|nr:heme biosynthesis protein HemY [Zoogloeaceae bacterium]MCW5596954.1 heme biosynthesis protein HemY [Rhodocyclaceae bacterium]
MRTLFWLLALFALAVGVSLAFGDNNGYVLIALPPWRAELSLNFFVVILALGFVLSYFLLRFLFHTLRLPQAVRAYRARKRREKALSALQDAMLQLYEGRYGHALKSAARTYAAGEAQALSALLAARAAHFLRDEQREREWLERAAEHDAEALAARLMTEAELHLEARRFEAALASLNAMQEKGRRQIAALRLALRAHRELGHWEDVLRVTRQLEKAHGLTPEGAAPLKLRAHQEALRARAGDAPALAAYWQAVPARERYVPQLAATAARVLIAAGDGPLAQRVIESQLEEAWDSELAELYADCQGGDMVARIARAEKWLVKQPQDARLLLALGRLCRTQQLWGKAQSYFEASLAVKQSQDAYAELASLFTQLDRHEEANQAYRSAAALCIRPSLSA